MIFQPNLIVHVFEPTTDQVGFESHLPFTTHELGPTKYPLTTSGNSSIIQAHYGENNEPFSGPVNHLTFIQLGSCTLPNLAPYASTCESVKFNGYIDSVRTVFEVVDQLPNVSKVEVSIGPAEQHCYLSDKLPLFFKRMPVSTHVESLKIIMDLDYFHSFQHDCNGDPSRCIDPANCTSRVQQSLVELAELLLKHAGKSFPNLKSLVVDLPEDDRLFKGVRTLINLCPGLRRKTQTSWQNYMPGNSSRSSSADIYSIESSGEYDQPYYHSTPSWFPPTTSTPIRVEMLSSEDEMISPSSESYPGLHTEKVTIVNHRPPPGFAPLPVSSSQTEVFVQGAFEEIEVVDPEQRVTSWLSSIE